MGVPEAAGTLAVGRDAPLQFTLKDTNGVDVHPRRSKER